MSIFALWNIFSKSAFASFICFICSSKQNLNYCVVLRDALKKNCPRWDIVLFRRDEVKNSIHLNNPKWEGGKGGWVVFQVSSYIFFKQRCHRIQTCLILIGNLQILYVSHVQFTEGREGGGKSKSHRVRRQGVKG